jgi:hypothetical protein
MADVGHIAGDIGTQRAPRLDARIARVADSQYGRISHRQLLALGLSASAIRKRVMSGRLHVVHRGVYAVGHAAAPVNGRLMAAVLAGGSGALVSHRSAAWLHGVLDDSRAVIDVVGAARRRSREGIVFHRSRRLDESDRGRIANIPVTSLPRTLLDIAAVIQQRRLVYALERAEKLGVFDFSAIHACCARNKGHHGLKPLTAAIQAIEPEAAHAHDGIERTFIAFCKRYAVPPPAMNASVAGLTVDALWAKQKVIVELDSWTHHRTRKAFEEDRRRDATLKLAGYEVLRVTDCWLKEEPAQLAATLLNLLHRG